MGKTSALVFVVIGVVVLLLIGLPVTFYLLVYSSQQGYPAISIALSILVSLVLFVLIPLGSRKGDMHAIGLVRRWKERSKSVNMNWRKNVELWN